MAIKITSFVKYFAGAKRNVEVENRLYKLDETVYYRCSVTANMYLSRYYFASVAQNTASTAGI